MTLLLLAGLVLIAGMILALSLRKNLHRFVAALLTQALAVGLTGAAIAPTCFGGPALEASWTLPFPMDVVHARVDALSAFFLAWSLPFTLLGTLYAGGYLRAALLGGRNGGPHFALLNVVSLSFLIVYAAQNALIFLIGWELAAVAAWLLVIWDYRDQKTRFAGFNYLVSTHIGLLALVAAFMYLHGQTHSMAFDAFGPFLAVPSGGRSVVFLLLGASFALKSAFFPVHSWLPRAHAAAPAHVSALMSGVIHKAGLFALLRFTLLLGTPEPWMGWSVLGFGALSAVFGVLYTTSQRDLKRLLGYSSTENVGIAAMGFGVAYLGMSWHEPTLVALGLAGGLLHLVNHAFFKCLLFYAAGSVYRATHTVDIERLGGLWKRLPVTGTVFLIGAIAITGLPPLNGFASEFIVYSGLLSGAAPTASANAAFVASAAVLAFVGAVSALSMARAFGVAFLGSPRDETVIVHGEAPRTMRTTMAVHAIGVVTIGLLPTLAVHVVTPVLRLFGVPPDAAASVASAVVPVQVGCAVLLASGVAVGTWAARRVPPPRASSTWGCGEPTTTARMQYTGSSFGQPFVLLFGTLLPHDWRARLSRRVFPRREGSFQSHSVDAVEHRIFEVLGRGEDVFVRAAAAVPEEPRFAFAAGLAAIIVIGGLVLSRGGA